MRIFNTTNSRSYSFDIKLNWFKDFPYGKVKGDDICVFTSADEEERTLMVNKLKEEVNNLPNAILPVIKLFQYSYFTNENCINIGCCKINLSNFPEIQEILLKQINNGIQRERQQ